jgi:hypothetical protein
LVLAGTIAAAQTFNGPAFRVETYTTGSQGATDVAVDSGGHFIVTWAGDSDTDDLGIYARRYKSSGVPLGPAFRVNTYTTYEQMAPAVAVDPNGRFVVVWQSFGPDGDSYGVRGQLFAPDGTPSGGEFQVNGFTTGYQYLPDVAFAADGTFVVTWQSDYQDGSGYGIVARRFDAAGAPLTGDFVVNTYTTGYQYAPKIAAASIGFGIAWDGQGGGDNDGIFARVYDATATPIPTPPLNVQFRVNTATANYQRYASVAAGGSNFLVAWEDVSATLPEQRDVFARRYPATFIPTAQFRVNTYTTDFQMRPNVAVDSAGQFVVTWASGYYTNPGAYDVMAQLYSNTGVAVGTEFMVNSYTTGYQRFPAAAAGRPGDFLIAWEGEEDGTLGVLGQRFGDLIYSDNAESGTTTFWSAVQPNIATTPAAAQNGTDFGFQATVNGLQQGVFLQDDSPDNENRYRARFYFDPNTHDPGEIANQRRVRVFVMFEELPNRRLVAVVLRRISGAYSMQARVQLDDDSRAETAFTPITDAPHWVEVEWRRATTPTANDGFFEMSIDGTAVPALINLDNNLSQVDMVRLGTVSNKTNANGVVFVDEFVSRRTNPIGP